MTTSAEPSTPSAPLQLHNEGDRSRATKIRHLHPLRTAGQLAYKVKTYQDDNVWEGAVDAWTGQIIGEGTATPVSKLDEEDQLELAGLPKASIDLSAATALAEEKGSGKAISAGLEETNGRVVYKVIIVNKGATTKFVVDPKSGQIK